MTRKQTKSTNGNNLHSDAKLEADATSAPGLEVPTQTGSDGIHISRGVTPRIPPGGLMIRVTGDLVTMEVLKFELQLDTCVHWLEIALDNLEGAESAQCRLLEAKLNGSEDLGPLVDREFKASVQAAVAAATFFEALYAATLEHVPKRQKSSKPSGGRRRKRYAWVTEQLRQSFGLKKQGTANLRSVLKEVNRFRDEAVHPSAKFMQPVLHPQLRLGMARLFVMFRFESAQKLVRAAVAFSKILPSRDLSRQPKAMREFGSYLLIVCEPLHLKWELRYGALLDEPQTKTDS